VEITYEKSGIIDIEEGLPHGSILGLLLVSIFIIGLIFSGMLAWCSYMLFG